MDENNPSPIDMDLQPEEDGNEEKESEEFNKDNFVPSNETPAPNEKKSEKMGDSSGHSSQVATEVISLCS